MFQGHFSFPDMSTHLIGRHRRFLFVPACSKGHRRHEQTACIGFAGRAVERASHSPFKREQFAFDLKTRPRLSTMAQAKSKMTQAMRRRNDVFRGGPARRNVFDTHSTFQRPPLNVRTGLCQAPAGIRTVELPVSTLDNSAFSFRHPVQNASLDGVRETTAWVAERQSHGKQQNAHRCLPPGRNTGCDR